MAIALESDFRSLKTGPMPELAERAAPPSGNGEAFARRLRQERGSDEPKAETNLPEPAAVSYGGPVIPLHPAVTDPASAEMATELAPVVDGQPVAEDVADTNLLAEPAVHTGVMSTPVMAATEDKAAAPATEILIDLRETQGASAKAPVEAPVLVPATGETQAAAEPVDLDTVRPPSGLLAVEAPPSPAPQLPVAAPEPVDAAATVVAAVTPATPKASATPEAPAVTPIPAGATAKSAPKAAEQANLADPLPVLTGDPASDLVADSPALAAETTAPTGTSTSTPATGATSGLATAAPVTGAPVTSTPAAIPMAPAQAVITASPAQIVDIVAQSAEDGQSDRIVVQLDPPELGRVSIDFKFDASGLQHVTITGETPEAMRQLRLMHHELVQSLERQGFSGQNMTFQQQQQNAQSSPNPGASLRATLTADETAMSAADALRSSDTSLTPRTMSGGRLDMKL